VQHRQQLIIWLSPAAGL